MNVLSIVLESLLALMFLMAGFGKISGSKMHVEGFKHWGLPQWFRIVTGLVELAGAAALIVGYWDPSWVAVGALILGITGIGGVITHLRVKDPFKQTFMILLLAIISIVLFTINASDLADFPGFK
ncbi:DoxX family protein [Paenibacillus sp. OV219]|uniref:DoxX family protein n=1 Tax=Paenibacillus sp. OV219 TaxID=1884377 RepID=UPI0008C5684E|nr:DoxX family protein [Paenibacillus sp. OV219]SEO72769.1 DoxX-like family protein [Paenibacillus sp. OV219]